MSSMMRTPTRDGHTRVITVGGTYRTTSFWSSPIYIYVNIICRLDQGVCGKSTPVVVVRLTGFNSRKSSECDWLCFAESLMVLNLQLVNNIIDGRLVCVPLGGRERGLFKLDWITCRGYFQRLASGLKMLRDTKLLSGLG